MWAAANTASAQEWTDCLEGQTTFAQEVATAANHAICAVHRFHEIYLGGDDSSCLLQLLAAGEAGETDVLASVLVPDEEVRVVFSERGAQALRLICSFWAWRPAAPAVLQAGGRYHCLMSCVPGADWTEGPLCPKQVGRLQRSENLQELENSLQIYVPGEPHAGEDQEKLRAAVRRESCVLSPDAL